MFRPHDPRHNDETLVGWALAYQEIGWRVLPTGEGSGRQAKAPHARALQTVRHRHGWGQLRDQPLTRREIELVWSHYPLAGIAVLTGDGLVVADVEHDAQMPVGLIAVDTPRARSASGGAHLFFSSTGTVQTRRREQTGFGDLLGEGTYVVVPPGSGRAWLRDPFDGPLAPLPEALIESWDIEERPNQPTSHVKWVGSEPPRTYEDALAAARIIGLKLSGRNSVTCPFHDDRVPSAGLTVGQAEDTLLSCRACNASWSLPQVYARIRNPGIDLRSPTVAKWARRLAHETGVAPLPEIEVTLPSGPESARKLAAGYLLLLRIDVEDPRSREATFSRGVPFSRSFGAPWCGLSADVFGRARRTLIKAGWFDEPTYEVLRGRRTMMLLPNGWAR